MISAARRVWTAANAVLLAHAIRTVFALGVLGPFGLELAALIDAHAESPTEARSDEGMLELLKLVLRALPSQAQSMAVWIAVYAWIAPLLTQLVLEALTQPNTLRIQLGIAWLRYPHALILSALRWALLALCAAIGVLLCVWLPSRVPAALEDVARIMPLSVCALAALWTAVAHDLCSSELARERSSIGTMLLRGARAARLAPLLTFAAFGLVSSAIFALGDVAARAAALPLTAIALQQTAGLIGAVARAQWLALTQSFVRAELSRPQPAHRATRASGSTAPTR